MSVIIIGGGHNAITKLTCALHKMTADQRAQANQILEDFVAKVDALVTDVDANP